MIEYLLYKWMGLKYETPKFLAKSLYFALLYNFPKFQHFKN
jgi:hypothetical protein